MKECMIEIMNPPPCGKWDCFRVCFSLTSSSFFFFFFEALFFFVGAPLVSVRAEMAIITGRGVD